MRKFLILALCALGTTALAQSAYDVCPKIGNVAEGVMTARQSGMVMSVVVSRIEALTDMGPDAKQIVIAMIMAAYEVPQFGGDEAKSIAIKEFRNNNELLCWKQF